MQLQRLYSFPEGWKREANLRQADGTLIDPSKPEDACLNPPPFAGVAVAHTGVDAAQNFSERLVNAAIAEGWMSISRGKLVLHAASEDLSYTVTRTPGVYCAHCGEKQESAEAAKAHIAAAHADKKSPDASNPAGYEKLNGFECVLDSEQHARLRSIGKPVYRFHRTKKGA
jgi:hypothetical protein